jgi:rhodanese-related sulfurtransferase
MKKVLIILLVILMIFLIVGCSQDDIEEEVVEQAAEPAPEPYISLEDAAFDYFNAMYNEVKVISFEDLSGKIDAGDKPFILSIRKKEQYIMEHIQGAYNGSWGPNLSNVIKKLPKDKTVYVYSDSGQTAGQAIALMRMLEIDAVSVESGFSDGVKKVEGYEKFIEITPNAMPDAGEGFNEQTLSFVTMYINEAVNQEDFMVIPMELNENIENGRFRFMDIREKEDIDTFDIQREHIPETLHQGITDQFDQFSKDDRIVVGSYTGQTSGQVVAVMRAMGYEAYSLRGGMDNGWKSYKFGEAAHWFFDDFYEHGYNTPWHMLHGNLTGGVNPTIIDLRSPEDYAKKHVKGAINAPFGQGLADLLDSISLSNSIFIYSDSGQISAMTAPIIRAATEFTSVLSLEGGFDGKSRKEFLTGRFLTDEPFDELPEEFNFYPMVEMLMSKEYLTDAEANGNNMITAEDLQAAMDTEELSIIDIRKVDSYNKGHIDGAIRIDFKPGMTHEFDNLPEGKLIVAGIDGQTAGYVVTVMRMLGHDALLLDGGMKAWEGADLPIVE